MVAAEFIDYVTSFKVTNYVGVEDFADKFNFLFTVVILLLCTTIVSVKQYLFKSIACYIPNTPSGDDFDNFLENYCWVHGTIPIKPNEALPQFLKEWKEKDLTDRINYYQWVPFVLGLQCILFYMPRVFWQMICYNRTGTDLENIISTASEAAHNNDDRDKIVSHVAHNLEDMFFQHRDFRQGRIAEIRRKAFSLCSFIVVSKRMGNWLFFSYFIIKLLYLSNGIGQLYLMQRFLGFNGSFVNFGFTLSHHIISGKEWEDTLIFPRVTFCSVRDVRHVGSINHYVAQCALPVNMLNEKIYIFLWFWTTLGCCLTVLSIPSWFMRVGFMRSRAAFVKKFLRRSENFRSNEKRLLQQFIVQFLRHDGVFLLRMLSLNAGDLVTTQIVTKLWQIYQADYSDRDMRNDKVSRLEDGHNHTTFRENNSDNKLMQEEFI